MTRKSTDPHKAVVSYHYFAQYRLPVMLEMTKQPDPIYSFISGRYPEQPALKTVDLALAKTPLPQGGLRWKFVRNAWFGGLALWQTGHAKLALSSANDTIIYLGDRRFLSTWISAILARLRGKRVLMWTHGVKRRPTGLGKYPRLWFYRLAHGLLLYNHRARELLLEQGFRPEDLYVVYNSLDYEQQRQRREGITAEQVRQTRRTQFQDPAAPILVSIGRLTANKRLDMLVEVCQRLNANGRPTNLLLIGDGPLRPALERQIRQAGLTDRVTVYGACYEEDELAPMMMASDLCVIPGAIGLTAMHAMAYGLPVVTSDCRDIQGPEFEAILPGVSGQFYRHGDMEDLTRSIAEWLDRPVSREHTARDCVRIIEERFNPQTQVEIINQAVNGIPATQIPLACTRLGEKDV